MVRSPPPRRPVPVRGAGWLALPGAPKKALVLERAAWGFGTASVLVRGYFVTEVVDPLPLSAWTPPETGPAARLRSAFGNMPPTPGVFARMLGRSSQNRRPLGAAVREPRGTAVSPSSAAPPTDRLGHACSNASVRKSRTSPPPSLDRHPSPRSGRPSRVAGRGCWAARVGSHVSADRLNGSFTTASQNAGPHGRAGSRRNQRVIFAGRSRSVPLVPQSACGAVPRIGEIETGRDERD